MDKIIDFGSFSDEEIVRIYSDSIKELKERGS